MTMASDSVLKQSSRQRKRVIIIGAGVGGSAAAARLAKAGLDVIVLEKNDFIGGRCSVLRSGPYRFDQGPSLLLMPKLFVETFADLSTSLAQESLELVKCEPNYSITFHDGVKVTLSTDMAQMKEEISRYEGEIDGFDRYLQFLNESHFHYELSIKHVLGRNFTSLLSMLRPSLLVAVLKMHAFTPLYTRVCRYFRTERMRRCFTFGSMYMGMSPFEAPSVYSLLQYAELAEGIWYPIGGFYKVVEKLVEVGKRYGAMYKLSTPVKSVKVAKDDSGIEKVDGIVLASTGETLNADIVLVNADLVYAYNNLLPGANLARSYASRLKGKPHSCSSISFYWSLDRQFPQLNAHNVFLSEHYRESFDDIFDKMNIPSDPSFYVHVPSRADPTAAPAGKDAVVVLLPVPHLDESEDWNSEESKYKSDDIVSYCRDSILNILERKGGLKGFRGAIIDEKINTPLTWRDTFNLEKGSILGLSIDFLNALSFRPRTKHASIEGLYFVGASAHPGMGVPVSLAGAKLVSEQILEDLGMPIPWKIQSQGQETNLPKSSGSDSRGIHDNVLDAHDLNLRKQYGITHMELAAWILGISCLCVAIFSFLNFSFTIVHILPYY